MAAQGSDGFTAEERAAMKERAREARRSSRTTPEQDEAEVVAKIHELQGEERDMAERIHAIVKEHAPSLAPKTWYGMPSYAKNGKSVVFFQAASKFKNRYFTLGFNDAAQLDDGTMWATSFALTKLTADDEQRIIDLVKRAAGE